MTNPAHPGNERTISTEAAALLTFLKDISGRYTLSGQHNYISTGSLYTDKIEQSLGKRPLVWGSDFSFVLGGNEVGKHYHCGPLNLSDPVEVPHFLDVTAEQSREAMIADAIAQHARGHIITLMWHCPLPQHGDTAPDYSSVWAMENRPDPQTWRELTTPGTTLHNQWLAQIDRIAGYLARLRDARVPVLWRPYHEMNGVWFWWCNQKGPEGFAKLWRLMHDRYTHHHQLDNLLWVWNANAPRPTPGDEAYDYPLTYPDGDTVDVLASDVYRNDYRASHHDDLVSLADGRPIALGEVGELPTPAILSRQPRWAWFMPWGCLVFKLTPMEALRALYNDPRVLSLADVKRSPDGTYRVLENH